MEFFSDSRVTDILSAHVEKVEKLEEAQAKVILKRYREIRQDLRDRLDTFAEGTFSSQQLQGVLVQVDAALLAMEQRLNDGMLDASNVMTDESIRQAIEEIERFEEVFTGAVVPINLDAVLIGTDTRNFLINRYESSLRAYSQDLRASISLQLTNSVIGQENLSLVVRRLGKFFLAEEWKLQRIARTELHNMFNVAKLTGYRQVRDDVLPDLKKSLFHPIDSRTGQDSLDLAEENPIVSIDKPFRQTFRGKEYIFMAPPNRPNDRAILVPYREQWNKNAA